MILRNLFWYFVYNKNHSITKKVSPVSRDINERNSDKAIESNKNLKEEETLHDS